MKELLWRVVLGILLTSLLLLFARPLFAQPPIESSLGTLPIPKIVGMTLEVWPKVVVANPWKAQAFHVRWRIEPSANNLSYTLVCDCGGELIVSTRQLHGETEIATRDWYPELHVLDTCLFEICLSRNFRKPVCIKQILEPP